MSTVSTTTDNAALAGLAQALFKRVDADGDGRLSAGEFKGFLESLLHKVGTAGSSAAAAAVATPAITAPKVYQGMLGFDYTKINNLSHATAKYVFARATQDLDFAWDRASRSAGLQRIADYAKEHGYPNSAVIGDDKIDFGDGNGAIDVLTGDGQWWWGPA